MSAGQWAFRRPLPPVPCRYAKGPALGVWGTLRRGKPAAAQGRNARSCSAEARRTVGAQAGAALSQGARASRRQLPARRRLPPLQVRRQLLHQLCRSKGRPLETNDDSRFPRGFTRFRWCSGTGVHQCQHPRQSHPVTEAREFESCCIREGESARLKEPGPQWTMRAEGHHRKQVNHTAEQQMDVRMPPVSLMVRNVRTGIRAKRSRKRCGHVSTYTCTAGIHSFA